MDFSRRKAVQGAYELRHSPSPVQIPGSLASRIVFTETGLATCSAQSCKSWLVHFSGRPLMYTFVLDLQSVVSILVEEDELPPELRFRVGLVFGSAVSEDERMGDANETGLVYEWS